MPYETDKRKYITSYQKESENEIFKQTYFNEFVAVYSLQDLF